MGKCDHRLQLKVGQLLEKMLEILGNFPGTFFTVWLNCLENLVKTTRQPPDIPGETKLKVDNFPFICCIVMFVMFL